MTTHRSGAQRGVTLIELLVMLAILGIAASIGGLAMRTSNHPAAREGLAVMVTETRARALRTGSPQSVMLRDSSGSHALTAFPDGSVTGDRILRVNRATGQVAR
jgi:prepilin-type N-terminal cleavage/methylation domain-containing protein